MTKLYEGKRSGNTPFQSTCTALFSVYMQNKYGVAPPSATTTACNLAGMLLIKPSNRSCGRDSQTAFKQVYKTSMSPSMHIALQVKDLVRALA